ncbi:Acyl-CoA reductase-like NAD-dependent aldehyde dehydrogenase [Deinococcus deserti]
MTIAREEIFGPVLVILGYDSVEQAVEIGNDTEYGLSAYVSGADLTQVARSGPSCVPDRWCSTARLI